ncbi:MAG: hypothetical protein ABIO69_08045 [Sphingomicrobium sp.]
MALIGGAIVILILVFLLVRGGNENSDKLTDAQVAGGASANDPEKLCAAQDTYDLIKRELFRRAAQLRGSDQGAFDKLAAYSVVRMDAPMLKSHDEDVGTIECTGTLALDLPPGVAVVGGRHTLTADLGYALQPAADGTGNVLTLTNDDSIVTPLATLARVGAPTGQPLTPDNPAAAAAPPVAVEPAPVAPPPPVAAPQPAASPRPSFDCRFARTRSELAVCNDTDSGLAGLDRQMAAQFNSAMAEADGQQRALLQSTRGRFLGFRDACRSNSCIADAYRGRMAEIRDIMAGRWKSPR